LQHHSLYSVVPVPLDEGERLTKKDRKGEEERKEELRGERGEEKSRNSNFEAADGVFELEREHNRSKQQILWSYSSFKSAGLFLFQICIAFFFCRAARRAGGGAYIYLWI
jgi:aryl-alcohol dehydrogenase-like predicted oxidoreductase